MIQQWLIASYPWTISWKHFQVDTWWTLNTSLISYYKLEDDTDFFWTNNWTNTNWTFVAGKVNNAWQGNWSNSRIDLPENSWFNFTTWSLACWIKSSSSGSIKAIFNNYSQFGSWTPIAGYQFWISPTWKIIISFWTWWNYNPWVTFFTFSWATTVTDGNWHFIVATWTWTSVNIYLDNNSTPDWTLSTSAVLWYNASVRTNIWTNEYAPWAFLDWYNWLTDEFGIWNWKVLSIQEKTDLYNSWNWQTMI